MQVFNTEVLGKTLNCPQDFKVGDSVQKEAVEAFKTIQNTMVVVALKRACKNGPKKG